MAPNHTVEQTGGNETNDPEEGFIAQYANSMYNHVTEQIKQQAAAALPPIAQQYLCLHAQRSEHMLRPTFEVSDSWEIVEHMRLEMDFEDAGDDEDDSSKEGWIVLSQEQQVLARLACGEYKDRRSGAALALSLGMGIASAPVAVGATAVSIGVAAAGLTAQTLAGSLGMGPRAPFPSIGVPPWDRFEDSSVNVSGEEWQFKTWLPYEESLASPGESPPVIVILHGYRECGWDNFWQCSSGLGTLLQHSSWSWHIPALVVLPQLPRKPWGVSWWEGWREQRAQEAVMAMLQQVVRKHRADRRRLYVIGESLGGEGAWYLAAQYPSTFAAVAAICGSVEPYDWEAWEWGSRPEAYDDVANKVVAPVWFCHGVEDPYIPVDHPRQIKQSLDQSRNNSWLRSLFWRSGAEVVYKEVPDKGHEIWDHAYNEEGVIEWCLAQSK